MRSGNYEQTRCHQFRTKAKRREYSVTVFGPFQGFHQSEHRPWSFKASIRRLRFLFLWFVSGLTILIFITGCAKKTVRNSAMVFNLDEVFNKKSISQDDEEIHDQWKERALELARGGELKEAIEAFERYIEQDPENYFGFNGLAVCYKKMKKPAAAMKNFDRALEFADEPAQRAKILGNIGNLYLDTNQLKTALVHYREAASVHKNHPYYLILTAFTFLKQGELERAQKVLAQAEAKISRIKELEDSEQGKAYYYMARCILGTGEQDRERVYRYLKLALEADPKRLVQRLKTDTNNGQSLFFTLKDEEDLKKLFSQYDEKSSTTVWNNKTQASGRSQSQLDAP